MEIQNIFFLPEFTGEKSPQLSEKGKRIRTIAWGIFTAFTATFAITRILSSISVCVLTGFFATLAYDGCIMTKHSDAISENKSSPAPSIRKTLEQTYILKYLYDFFEQKKAE